LVQKSSGVIFPTLHSTFFRMSALHICTTFVPNYICSWHEIKCHTCLIHCSICSIVQLFYLHIVWCCEDRFCRPQLNCSHNSPCFKAEKSKTLLDRCNHACSWKTTDVIE
jgi:hypothetical protein